MLERIERSENDTLRETILSFVNDYYEKNEDVPPIKKIIEGVKGLNNTKLYVEFPGGIGEICLALGVPAPTERIDATREARQGKKELPRVDDASTLGIMRLLGETDSRKALKTTEKVMADFTQYSLLYGLKSAKDFVPYFEAKQDVATDRILELVLENTQLRAYYWETDEELMDLLEIEPYIRKRFMQFKRRQRIKGNLFMSWFCDSFIAMRKEMERKIKEEESPYNIYL